MMEVTVEVRDDMAEVIRQRSAQIHAAVQPAMIEQAEKIRAASMEIVPVDQGILRASALEVGTNVDDRGVEAGVDVVIGYGGAARSYALVQHETPPNVFSHAPGRSWKYLERPMYEAAPQVREALVKAVTDALANHGTGETFA